MFPFDVNLYSTHSICGSTQWKYLGVFRHESISRGHLTGRALVRLSTKEENCTRVHLCTRSKPKPCATGMWKSFMFCNYSCLSLKKINKSSLIRFESRFVLQKVIEFNVVIFSIMFFVPLMFMCLVLNSCLSENSQCFFFSCIDFSFLFTVSSRRLTFMNLNELIA